MKIGAIIQARTSSTRLPGKVLKTLPYNSNVTVLEQVIRRVKKADSIDEIIVATTVQEDDQAIVDIAKTEDVRWFRGSVENVLERFFLAARENKLDIIVRITSDCPCIDWEIIDTLVKKHLRYKADYTSNTLERTYPHGLDAEVISFQAIEKATKKAKTSFEKEHVTPYIYNTDKNSFRLISHKAPPELTAPDIRITLDTLEDYALLCAVFEYLYNRNKFFTAKEIVNLFNEKPWLKLINKRTSQKKMYNSLEDEINEAINILKLNELNNVTSLLKKWKL